MKRLLATLLVLAAGCARDLDLPAATSNTIDGRAVAEVPGTGETVPAAGARVEFVGTGVAVLADAQGLFHVENPPPAPRTMLLSWSSTNGATADRQRLLKSQQLDRAGAIQLGDVLVAANATLRGRVLLADKADSDGAQIGTVVFIPKTPYATVTGEGGSFILPHIPPGTVSVAASRNGYPTNAVSGVDLSAGADLMLGALSLTATTATLAVTGSLTGKVLRLDGTAASGAQVSAVASQGGAAHTATSGADGAFTISDLPVGPYLVTITDTGSHTQAQVGGVLVQGAGSAAADVGSIALSTVPLTTAPPSGTPAPPVARAGQDQIVGPGVPVLVDGSASDGVGLVFHWSTNTGAAFSINDTALANRTTFIAPTSTNSLQVSLVVEDSIGQKSATSTLHVFVDRPPVARLTAPAQARTGTSILLDASTSSDGDASDVLTYVFSATAAPSGATVTYAAGATSSQSLATVSAEGTYTFTVTVSDGHLANTSAPATVLVANINHAPTAKIAPVSAANQGTDVILDGSGSSDPDPGDTLTYAWTALSGAPALTSGATAALAHLTAPSIAGSYAYQLVVTDSHALASAAATVSVVVNGASPPAIASVIATAPGDGSTNVSANASVEFDYSAALDASSVTSSTISVIAASSVVPGLSHYAQLGAGSSTRYAITFVPDVPFAPGASVSATVGLAKDLFGRTTSSKVITFTIAGTATWTDLSPTSPHRTGRCSGAPDGGVGFSATPLAPAIVTNNVGQSYLLDLELSTGAAGTLGPFLRHYDDGTQTGADGGVIPQGWSLEGTTVTNELHSVNGALNTNLPSVTNAVNAPWRRTYMSNDGSGYPSMGFDVDDSGLGSVNSALNVSSHIVVTRDGLSYANDGVTSWAAFIGCDTPGTTSQIEFYIAPTNVNSFTPSMVALKTTPAGIGSSCTAPQARSFDIYMGGVAIAAGSGKLYGAAAWKASTSTPYVMNVWSRNAGDTSPFGAPLSDTNHPAGQLNVGAVTQLSNATMVSSVSGPVLLFLETPGTNGKLRVTRFDESSQQFVDPLTGTTAGSNSDNTGSSVLAPLQLDGNSFNTPIAPSMIPVGRGLYIAWLAYSGTSGV
ncbi:MAG: carboxypeptidase regulatory-like domain-containing protein, partial [Deltaproteobacteria bacterium]|nr:carboxypeptidase regulatory-like domain-containing protein [Deltaproteobacteria bacterium]